MGLVRGVFPLHLSRPTQDFRVFTAHPVSSRLPSLALSGDIGMSKKQTESFSRQREERKAESARSPAPSDRLSSHVAPQPSPKARPEPQPGQGHEQGTVRGESAENPLAVGRAREARGDNRRAVDAYLTAAERGEWGPAVEAALLRDEFLLKTYPYAAERLLRLTARPQSVPLWRRVARLCETQGDYAKASGLLTEALRANPNDVASLSMLARMAEHQQYFTEATQWHRRILELRPDMRASLVFLAGHHYAQGEYREALPYFERLLLQARGERSDELYWLLCQVKSAGVQGLEERISQVL